MNFFVTDKQTNKHIVKYFTCVSKICMQGIFVIHTCNNNNNNNVEHSFKSRRDTSLIDIHHINENIHTYIFTLYSYLTTNVYENVVDLFHLLVIFFHFAFFVELWLLLLQMLLACAATTTTTFILTFKTIVILSWCFYIKFDCCFKGITLYIQNVRPSVSWFIKNCMFLSFKEIL